MIRFNQSSFHRRVVAPLLIVAWLTGCTKWVMTTDPLPDVMADDAPDVIRVTLLSGEKRELRDAVVLGGMVRGRWVREGWPDTMTQFPTDSVATVEVKKTDTPRTLVLLALVVVLPLAIIAASAASREPEVRPPPPTCSGGCEFVSCPVVYSWDGSDWRLDSGTFGGAIFEPLARTDLDNLDHARTSHGALRLKLANELPETEHVDALAVLAVDHPPGVTVVPDGSSIARALVDPEAPVEARDYSGRNVLGELTWSDGWAWESAITPRDTSNVAELRDGVELVFERPAGATEARLMIDGHNTEWAAALVYSYVQMHGEATRDWYEAVNENPTRAVAIGEAFARAGFLQTDVMTPDGWSPRGRFWEAGPEISKRQVMDLDLSEVEGDRVRVRLRSLPSFWRLDRVAMDFGPAPDVSVTRISPRSAITGRGEDVRAPLLSVDGDEWIMSHGDFAVLELDPPPVPTGMERTYLLETHGWYQIDAAASGPPLDDLLRRVEAGPDAMARVAIGLQNGAIDLVQRDRAREGRR